ncbi:DUF4129 domain-containing protein [Spirulina sp. CCNP1310]|uniref:DUF4129 domain-containing protein n=1 Tax=Spirulina sp. CCNP1310 TaxID=3110249 RepID=UPI002B21DAB6|nr:DUF4129 domain-containing protein [Spirulina sp. CCNP1310]MEA5420636.1 DUF4129 domain-containing protein [Spirulina sp. CCNP1310]
MSEFAKDGLGWRWGQVQQQVAEWWAWQMQQAPVPDDPDVPNWLTELPWGILGRVVAWGGIGALTLWGVWVLWRSLHPYWQQYQNRTHRPPTDLDKTQQYTAEEWRSQAQTYYRQGNFQQACLCLYGGMLQTLHDRGIAPHLPSRTDGEYVAAIQSLPRPEPYLTLLTMHQGLRFGETLPNDQLFEQCWRAYGEL